MRLEAQNSPPLRQRREQETVVWHTGSCSIVGEECKKQGRKHEKQAGWVKAKSMQKEAGSS